MRICTVCGIEKPLDCFHRNKPSKGGRLSQCKACRKEKRAFSIGERKARAVYKKRHRKITLAHRAVSRAVKSGKLLREACSVCGSEHAVAHHCDYDKQLDVMWLCDTHHREWHKENGRGLNYE